MIVGHVYCVECGEWFSVERVAGDFPDDWRRYVVDELACGLCWGALDLLPLGIGGFS